MRIPNAVVSSDSLRDDSLPRDASPGPGESSSHTMRALLLSRVGQVPGSPTSSFGAEEAAKGFPFGSFGTSPLRHETTDDLDAADSWAWWSYYLPALKWIKEYRLEYLLGDTIAGMTLASYQIPIVMSYANSLARVPTICGLYGLVVPPFVYALLGSVPQMIIGPEGPISLVVGQAVTPYRHTKHPEPGLLSPAEVAGVLAASGGFILLMSGLARFGFLEAVLSRALLRGFISAVGVVMAVDQIPSELGLEDHMHKVTGTHPSTFGKVVFLCQHFRETHALTAKVAFTALAVILAARFAKRRLEKHVRFAHFFPEILIVVLASTMLSQWLDLKHRGLEVVGKIKPGTLEITFPIKLGHWHDFQQNFSASFFAALLGFFESTIAARALGSKFDVNVSTNRELVALGTANLAGSFVRALPSFGGYARSKINALSGAQTQMSSIMLSAITVLAIAYALPLFYYLPKCVLSAVITAVGISLIEEAPGDVKFYWRTKGWYELLTLALTFTSTFFWSVQTGIAVGVGFSLVRVINHATHPRIQILGRVPGTTMYRNVDNFPPDTLDTLHGCLVVKIPEPLIFANTGDLRNRLRRLEYYKSMKVHPSQPRRTSSQELHTVVFDLRGMTELDAAAIQVLHEIVSGYVNRGLDVYFTRMPVKRPIRELFVSSGINALVMNQAHGRAFFDSIDDALLAAHSRHGDDF